MALLLAKTQIIDDDYPAGGSGQYMDYDPVSEDKIYTTGPFNTDNGSWSGTRFQAAGAYPWLTRPYGMVQTAALELEHDPFLVHQAAGFPVDPEHIDDAYFNLSGGVITQYREDCEWHYTTGEPAAGEWYLYKGYIPALEKWGWMSRTLVEVPLATGIVGLAAIVVEDGELIARPVLTSGESVSLEAGVIQSPELARALREWSLGRCFGFEWFLLPGSAAVPDGTEATAAGLNGVLSATSSNSMGYEIMGGESRPTGAAMCSWVTYQGCQMTGGRAKLSQIELPAGSRTPEAWPPRMD